MRTQRAYALVVLLVILSLMAMPAFAGEVDIPLSGLRVSVKSLKEIRESRVVRQDYDFSCGSAAVATLLTFSYDMPTSEREAFDQMFAVGDQAHIQQYGFSLLDMQKYLASRGLHAVGYKMSIEKLRRLHVPAIVLINPNGYNHFVVVRGWRNGAAVVADPRLGLRRMANDDFKKVWNGIVFVLRDMPELAQARYNDDNDFKIFPRGLRSGGMYYGHESATDYLVNIPIFNEF